MRTHHHQPRRILGDMWGDIANAALHPADTASAIVDAVVHPADSFNAIVSKGPDAVTNAIKQTWRLTGPVGDFVANNMQSFARTPTGKTVLDILAGAASMSVACTPLAPLYTLVWAVPGLLRGDDFTTAWLHGTVGQLVRVAHAIAGADISIDLPPEVTDQIASVQSALTDNTGAASQFLEQHAGDLAAVGLPASLSDVNYIDLAARLGIREDAAALALTNIRNNAAELADTTAKLAAGFFDPLTGKANVSEGVRVASSPFADKLRMSAPAARAVALPASAYAASPFAKLHTLGPLLRSVIAPSPTAAPVAVSSRAPSDVSTPAPAASAPMSTGEKVAIGVGVVGALGLLAWLARARRWM